MGSSSSNGAGTSTNAYNNQGSNTAAFGQNIYAPQGGALQQYYNRLGSAYDTSNEQVPGVQNAVNKISGQAQNTWGNQLSGGAYRGMQLPQMLTSSLKQSESSPSNTSKIYADVMGGQGNNYADAMKASYLGDANRATSNMLSNLDARAAASGMSGGSRHGIATSQGLYDINSNLQKNLAETGYNTFDKDLQNKLAIAQQADQGTLARQNLMSQLLGQQQQATVGALDNTGQMQNSAMNAFSLPWANVNSYQRAIGNPTVLSSGSTYGQNTGAGFGMGTESNRSHKGGFGGAK